MGNRNGNDVLTDVSMKWDIIISDRQSFELHMQVCILCTDNCTPLNCLNEILIAGDIPGFNLTLYSLALY